MRVGAASTRGIGLALLLALCAAHSRAQERPAASDTSWQSLEAARADALATGRPILAYVKAPWCALCHRLERDVFPTIAPELRAFATAEINLADRPDPGTAAVGADAAFAWIRTHGLETPPAFVVLTPDGHLLAAARGFLSQHQLRMFLRQARR